MRLFFASRGLFQKKKPQKIPRVFFWTFGTFCGTFGGFGVGGSQTPVGRLLRLFGVSEFWALPCPSFPWSFRKHQGKPQKHQGFLSPGEPLKTLENKQKTPQKTKEFRGEKKTKETKTPRKGRTGYRWSERSQRYRDSNSLPNDGSLAAAPWPSNLAFFGRGKTKQGRPEKTRISLSAEPWKSLKISGKPHRRPQNENKKKQGNRKKQGLEGQGFSGKNGSESVRIVKYNRGSKTLWFPSREPFLVWRGFFG